MFIQFENREEYIAWAMAVIYADMDMNNSNATGNALMHAQKCAELTWPAGTDGPATERDQYLAWAMVVMYAKNDKNNSNAVGNALAHAQRCVDLLYPATKPEGTIPSLPMKQPPRVNSVMTSVQGKAPPVPGEKAEVPAIPIPQQGPSQ